MLDSQTKTKGKSTTFIWEPTKVPPPFKRSLRSLHLPVQHVSQRGTSVPWPKDVWAESSPLSRDCLLSFLPIWAANHLIAHGAGEHTRGNGVHIDTLGAKLNGHCPGGESNTRLEAAGMSVSDAFRLYAPAAMPYHQPAVYKHSHFFSFKPNREALRKSCPAKAGGPLNAVSEHHPLVKLDCTLRSSKQPTKRHAQHQ
jgi:hypothetical protein